MRTQTRWILVSGAVVVLLGGALAGAKAYISDRALESVRPKRGEITEAVYGLGKVKSVHRFEVKLGVISSVRKLYVREGDFVKKGEKLIEFDSNALFRAPFDGTVTLTAAYDGEIALPNTVVLRFEDLKDRFIELSLEQQGALRVQRGQAAKISFESLRGRTLQGKVSALFPREDEFLAHIQVQDLDESVLPGMTADVSVEIGKIPDALLIPLRAVHNGSVLVRRNGKRRHIPVEIGHVDGLSAEIKGESLAPEDEVLVPKAEK